MTVTTKTKLGLNRRSLLKSAAGTLSLAAGSGAITGFPYVISAEPKVLRYLGTAVNEGDDMREALASVRVRLRPCNQIHSTFLILNISR